MIATSPEIETLGSGTTFKEVSGTVVSKIIFPFPPLAEQKRIVAKLEELMPLIEQYDAAEKKLSALDREFSDKLRKSILQQAIQGKLTEQLQTDGDARDLLEKIRADKAKLIADGKIKKEKPLPPIRDNEKHFDIPDNWQWVRLGEVCQINPRNKTADENIDATFLPMVAINDGYDSNYNPLVRTWHEIKNGFTHFADGDVIIAKITPCFQNRKSAIVENLVNGIGAGTTELYVLRSYGKFINEKYLLYFVKNQKFITDGLATMKGTAGQQRVSKNFISNYLLPLPPLDEQERIVAKLNELLPLCDSLSEKIKNY